MANFPWLIVVVPVYVFVPVIVTVPEPVLFKPPPVGPVAIPLRVALGVLVPKIRVLPPRVMAVPEEVLTSPTCVLLPVSPLILKVPLLRLTAVVVVKLPLPARSKVPPLTVAVAN
jgi:hypothetical protein